MSKKINKKTRRVVSALLMAGALNSMTSVASFADEKMDITNIPGFITVGAEYGDVLMKDEIINSTVIREMDSFALVTKEDVESSKQNGDKNVYLYGIPSFNNMSIDKDELVDEKNEGSENNEKSSVFHIDSFILWLNEKYPEFKEIFTENLDTTNDLDLINAFEKASELDNYTFAYAQQYYYLENAIYPVIERIKEETNIDFSKDRALEELAYSIIVQFGETGALKLVENAIEINGITNESDSQEIVEAIQESRVKKYETLVGASDEIKESLINKTNELTDDYLELVDEETSKEVFENRELEAEVEVEEKTNGILSIFGNLFSFLNM